MITALKLILVPVIVFLLSYPFITPKGRLRKLFVGSSLKYSAPHNRKNLFFVILALLLFVVSGLLFDTFHWLATALYAVPFVGKLFSNAINSISSQTDYVLFTIKLVLINLIMAYAFVFIKLILKKVFLNRIFGIGKSHKLKQLFSKNKKKASESPTADEPKEDPSKALSAETEEDALRKRKRIPQFAHVLFEEEETDEKTGENESEKKEKREYGRFMRSFLSLFFEGDEFQYARSWVLRTRSVLQFFIHLVEVVYLVFVAVILVSVFFPLPNALYDLIVNVLKFKDWFVYPAISLLFLQELCNVFDTDGCTETVEEAEKKKNEEKEARKREARIRALLAELKKRFDAEHSLRYYPEALSEPVPEYECTSAPYASALEYIRNTMQRESGHVNQSYMECLDAIYNDSHVYFSASFYSEFGEYLIAYTYIRLLLGERQIFVVSDSEEKETLRTYISDRLMKMTGSSANASWRIYTSEERLDQADILIATPEDFINKDIIEQYPSFFEEASNAVFIDADRLIALDSYLCPVMATKLQRATNGRIGFIFLSLYLIKGFASGSLPKFFCVDKVLSFSSAKENESVSYILWNKESKKHRIYNKNVQKLTCLETIIAELACRYGMDGVRLITEASIGHAERKVLAMHDVEINNLYKNVVDVNYMIYSDDRCNLSAALYACTRFRGRKKSIVHILSKPYLLREYFMSKAMTEDHIIRSSFIQPRVTEHAERHKLSLLRIFCEVTADGGMAVSDFEARMKSVISVALERNDLISSAYCRQLLKQRSVEELKISDLAAYLLSGLCDTDLCSTEEEERALASQSLAHRIKNFYIVVDPAGGNGRAFAQEKYITFNRTKEIFDRLLQCNERVELRLNDEVIGKLDTFPTRVHLEYIEGQSIVYKNTEYEIERIANDGKTIYLRRENISIKNCLDTVLLRNYVFNSLVPMEDSAVLNNSKSVLEEIRVTRCKADFVGNTYGFYSLTADRQTLDFYSGVEGNPLVDTPHKRRYVNSGTVHVELRARMECNDGMRLLLSAVFNEFIRTIFPNAYHGIAICPVLAEPLGDESEYKNGDPLQRIKALYPYIKNAGTQFTETDPSRMQFIFINDSVDDVGVLDWFYDKSARYMQEFLANIYSYLHWLKLCPERSHYIYFGGDSLCECFDLEGCCKLLEDFNLILSDEGETDIETAGNDVFNEELQRCAFCHKYMESGRYSFFDKNRFICADCFNTVDSQDQLEELYMTVKEYLKAQYGNVTFAPARVRLDGVYELPADKTLSEYYYRLDYVEKTIFVEQDDPVTNVCVSILRGIIAFWQSDNGMANHYSSGQLYYEELKYLREKGETVSADWIYENLPKDVVAVIKEITDYVDYKDVLYDEEGDASEEAEAISEEEKERKRQEKIESLAAQESRTSFTFMIMKKLEEGIDEEYDEDPFESEEYSNELYDPNKIPRFWKRYLRNQHIDDGAEENLADAEETAEEIDSSEEIDSFEDNASVTRSVMTDNAPLNEGESDEAVDPAEEKRRKKEEKKRLRAERERKKQEKWEKKIDALTEEEEKRKRGEDPRANTEKGSKKWSLFGRKKKVDTPTDEPIDEPIEKSIDEPIDEPSKKSGQKDKKPEKTVGKKKKAQRKGQSYGEKTLPFEEEEKTNPKIRIYNELVRYAYDYKEEPIDRTGVSDDELNRIFTYVVHDYPELFWVSAYKFNSATISHNFRCRNANGEFDRKQVDKKRAELRKAAKFFTKGITRRTEPYEALLTIYRRLILTLDYDTVGLNAGIGKDESQDDTLRSLYNALVRHKVVCAGYAVAMQYLLQSVGIVCAYVSSERDSRGGHAFNMLKLGKYCYYLDSTWGDYSSTEHGNYKNDVFYTYCCVPYEEFLATAPNDVIMHTPNKQLYPDLEEFHHTNHEYFRYHNAYLKSYNEGELVRIFAEAAMAYDPKTMGNFSVDIRCSSGLLAKYFVSTANVGAIVEKAKASLGKKNKKAAKLLDGYSGYCPGEHSGVIKFLFSQSSKQEKK